MARSHVNTLIRRLGPILLPCLLLAEAPTFSQRVGAASDRLSARVAAPPLIGLGPLPGETINAAARFRYARHFVRPGETLSAAITLSPLCLEIRCFVGADWAIAGAPPAACAQTALICSWKVAQPPTKNWIVATLPITTTSGPTGSTDAYAVLDKDQFVIDGTIADSAGNPFTGASVVIAGAHSGTIPVDANGYFNVFLPRGGYTLAVNAGSPQADRWFRPSTAHITLGDRSTTNFTAFNRTIIRTSAPVLDATGTGVLTATVQLLNPAGQGVPNRLVRINAGGPASLLCSVMPSTGLVEPQDVVNGTPLYAPIRLATDNTGTITFQVFGGTTSGRWRLTASDAATAALPPDADPSLAQATVAMPAPAWRAHLPTQWKAKVYTKGRGKIVELSLPRLIYDAAHGLTTRDGASLLHGTTDVRTILRWMQAYLPFQGLLLTPLSTAGTTAGGVLISTWNGRETRVLDISVLVTMVNWPIPINLPKDLPTLAAWQAVQGASAVRAYPGTVPESGLTYNGFPYLPTRVDLYNSFESRCLQKAQGN